MKIQYIDKALSASSLVALVRENVQRYIDQGAWDKAVARQEDERARLYKLAKEV